MTAAALNASSGDSSARRAPKRVLPGFGLTLGYTLFYLSIIVLIPLSAAFIKTASLSWSEFWSIVTAPRVLASYRLTFGASLAAAAVIFDQAAAGDFYLLTQPDYVGSAMAERAEILTHRRPPALRTKQRFDPAQQ